MTEIFEKNGKFFSPTIVLKCEIAFPYLLETAELNNKFGVTLVFDSASPELVKAKNIIDEISQKFCGQPDSLNAHPRIKEYKGKMQISATRGESLGRPRVVDVAKRPLTEAQIKEVGSSSLCNVAVSFASYEYLKKKGVTCYLQAVQVIEARQYGVDPFDDLSDEFAAEFESDVAGLL